MGQDIADRDDRCINALRGLCIDAIETARSGHPGLPLGAAPMAYVLFDRHLRHAPTDPHWFNRDRFVLSAGHGSMLLYALLHLCGYDLTEADLRAFRQRGSRTPGHPEVGVTPGVEANTGPLGQGAGNSVGMAVAERIFAGRFNRPGHALVDHRTYALVSDGDLMEGICHEAASLAGHWRLGKLTWLYDANGITLDGPAALSMSEDVAARFAALHWHVVEVADGDHDLAAIDAALSAARAETTRPSLIIVRTTIGYGAPSKQGSSKSHGAPLGASEARAAKAALKLTAAAPFAVDPQARAHLGGHVARGRRAAALWQAQRAAWAAAYPALAAELQQSLAGQAPARVVEQLEAMAWQAPQSTREASGAVLQVAAACLPQLLGGDADLSTSTLTAVAEGGDFAAAPTAQATGARATRESAGSAGIRGRNLRFGVREHAMAAIANGLAYHGGLLPYVATFFAFSDYLRPALRMAAIAELASLWLFTHDSVALGEDGPTHQPIEQLASLRAMPNVVTLRPADAHEVRAAWRVALELCTGGKPHGPIALVLSRQKVPLLPAEKACYAAVRQGGYVLWEAAPSGAPDAILLASGAEVHVALQAAQRLAGEQINARVVSLPSWELFTRQPEAYRQAVLPPEVKVRVSVEAAATFGWQRWVGEAGVAVGIDRFGLSAPGQEALEALGITASAVVGAVHAARAQARGSRTTR